MPVSGPAPFPAAELIPEHEDESERFSVVMMMVSAHFVARGSRGRETRDGPDAAESGVERVGAAAGRWVGVLATVGVLADAA